MLCHQVRAWRQADHEKAIGAVRLPCFASTRSRRSVISQPLTAAALGAFDAANRSDKSDCVDCGKPTISPHPTVVRTFAEKKQLREQCETATNGTKSKTSALTRIRANFAKVKDVHGYKHIIGNHEEVTAAVICAVTKLSTCLAELDGVPQSGAGETEEKLEQLIADLGETSEEAEEFFSGVKFVVGQGVDLQRRQQMHVRYLKQNLLEICVGRCWQ